MWALRWVRMDLTSRKSELQDSLGVERRADAFLTSTASASDIILTDDNFASILNAIEEGRRMFDNVQAFILHLLSGNVMLCLSLLVGLAFKDVDGRSVFPLSPIEILWILIITSAFPAFGLGAQPASPDILNRPPHDVSLNMSDSPLTSRTSADGLDSSTHSVVGASSRRKSLSTLLCTACSARCRLCSLSSSSFMVPTTVRWAAIRTCRWRDQSQSFARARLPL